MEDLKYNLFSSVKTEADRYLRLSRTSNNQIDREIARQRYLVLYDLLVESALIDEYEAWEWDTEDEEE
ncbi:MAG: hypothetical protein U0L58_10550 [Ruminococcus sp.]|nr:hypothetical protein [Ruminococcus sp.]